MLHGIAVSLLCLLALPLTTQHDVKEMMGGGRRTLDQGYHITPIQIFSRIVAFKPNLYEVRYLIALSKYHLKDYKGAGDDCRRALILQPCTTNIYRLYGISNIHVRRYDSTIIAFTHTSDITPNSHDYRLNRAYRLYQVGDSKAALQQPDYILKRQKPFDAASQLRAGAVAGRKPKRQPMKSGTPYSYRLLSLRIESKDKLDPTKNKPPFSP